MTRKFLVNLTLALLLGFALLTGWRHVTVPKPENLGLRDGDLIFQTKLSVESPAIIKATKSYYTHVGVIYYHDFHYFVIDAGNWGVRINRFDTWVSAGIGNKFAVYRHKKIKDKKRKKLMDNVQHHIGKPYDYAFAEDENAFYNAELPYLAYKAAKLKIGEMVPIGALDLNQPYFKAVFRVIWRWQPACKETEITRKACLGRLKQQKIITPESLASDKKMVQIFSNY